MKRIFAVLLILALLAGCVPALAYDESLLYGTWVRFDRMENGEASIECFTLTEDHKVFWLYQRFKETNDGFSRNYTGTWTFENGNAYIVIGNTAKMEGFITTKGQFADKVTGGYILYDKLEARTEEQQTIEPTNGQKIPQGEYLIGKYIAPGDYRVTLVGEDLAVVWVEKPGSIVGKYYSLVYYTGETEVILTLEEGYTFRVEHSSVILTEMTGF